MQSTYRSRAVLLAISVVLGTAALLFGAHSAGASHCDEIPSDPGNFTFNVSGLAEAGMDQDNVGDPGAWGFYICTWSPSTGHIAVGIHQQDASPATPGVQSAVDLCTEGTCPLVHVGPLGAELNPTSAADLPTDGDGTTGVSGGTGAGTCVYADSSPTCRAATVGAAIAEGDLPVTTLAGANNICAGVFVNGTCVGTWVTAPSSVSVTLGSAGADTIELDVAGTSESVDVPQSTVPIL
jgi:hypothetical protein